MVVAGSWNDVDLLLLVVNRWKLGCWIPGGVLDALILLWCIWRMYLYRYDALTIHM